MFLDFVLCFWETVISIFFYGAIAIGCLIAVVVTVGIAISPFVGIGYVIWFCYKQHKKKKTIITPETTEMVV